MYKHILSKFLSNYLDLHSKINLNRIKFMCLVLVASTKVLERFMEFKISDLCCLTKFYHSINVLPLNEQETALYKNLQLRTTGC